MKSITKLLVSIEICITTHRRIPETVLIPKIPIDEIIPKIPFPGSHVEETKTKRPKHCKTNRQILRYSSFKHNSTERFKAISDLKEKKTTYTSNIFI